MKNFDNKDRTRYYGLRVGDLVSPKGLDGKEWNKGACEVINYGIGDNNKVEIKAKDGTITDWVAEWCDIITKVEDLQKVNITNEKHEKAKYFVDKFDNLAIDVVQEIILYVTGGEPDYTGKTICLQELQNEIRRLLTRKLQNNKKRFCAKPIGEICMGDETDAKCGTCGHWIEAL